MSPDLSMLHAPFVTSATSRPRHSRNGTPSAFRPNSSGRPPRPGILLRKAREDFRGESPTPPRRTRTSISFRSTSLPSALTTVLLPSAVTECSETYGNGHRATSTDTRDSRPFHTRNTPRSFSALSTRCCAAGPGPPGRARFGPRFATGIIRSGARFLVVSAARRTHEGQTRLRTCRRDAAIHRSPLSTTDAAGRPARSDDHAEEALPKIFLRRAWV